jgi:hypothetical protein
MRSLSVSRCSGPDERDEVCALLDGALRPSRQAAHHEPVGLAAGGYPPGVLFEGCDLDGCSGDGIDGLADLAGAQPLPGPGVPGLVLPDEDPWIADDLGAVRFIDGPDVGLVVIEAELVSGHVDGAEDTGLGPVRYVGVQPDDRVQIRWPRGATPLRIFESRETLCFPGFQRISLAKH